MNSSTTTPPVRATMTYFVATHEARRFIDGRFDVKIFSIAKIKTQVKLAPDYIAFFPRCPSCLELLALSPAILASVLLCKSQNNN